MYNRYPYEIKEKQKLTAGMLLVQILITLAALFFAAPVLIILNYSFKTTKELYLSNPLELPAHISLDNYIAAYKKLDLGVTYFNTIMYTAVSVALLALLCGAAAWAIARGAKGFFRFSYVYFLIGILIPFQALFLPIYVIGFKTGLTNNRIGIILMYIATGMSFGVFLMTSFMSSVPLELEEAARIDGCNVYRTYFSIVMPLLKPAVATLSIMLSFMTWNDYLMANLFLSNKKLKTLTVAMQALFSQRTTDYTTAVAAIILSALPVTILFIVLQKYFIKGMTVGAIKG